MLKNKRPLEDVIGFNLTLKMILIILLIILSANQINNFNIIFSEYKKSYSEWENTMDYYIISDFSTSDRLYDPYSEKNMNIEKELYLYFNKRNAIFADFSYYALNFRKSNTHIKENYKLDYIFINPNYLLNHEILDENGDRITIPESDENYIILVPASYKEKEEEIIEYHNFLKNAGKTHDSHSHQSGNDTTDVYKQKIKLVWTMPGQKYFSYRIDINPSNSNYVTDPIARVITESNGEVRDYNRIIGYNGRPLKIKVDDEQSSGEKMILSKLYEYFDKNQYKFHVISVFDSVKQKIIETKNILYINLSVIVLLFIIMLVLLVQNCICYFELFKVNIALKNILGYEKIDIFLNFLLINVTTWLIILLVIFILNKSSLYLMLIILYLFETIFSYMLLENLLKRNMNNIVKGW